MLFMWGRERVGGGDPQCGGSAGPRSDRDGRSDGRTDGRSSRPLRRNTMCSKGALRAPTHCNEAQHVHRPIHPTSGSVSAVGIGGIAKCNQTLGTIINRFLIAGALTPVTAPPPPSPPRALWAPSPPGLQRAGRCAKLATLLWARSRGEKWGGKRGGKSGKYRLCESTVTKR